MDLYSASRRFARPFVFADASARLALPLAARGIVGDGQTAALVRADGVIDWLCFPRFDSPSVLGGVLDPERGGSSGIGPAAYPFESMQAYEPDTNVLETLHTVHGQGVLRVIDYMPWSDDPRATIHELHRRIECREGAVEVEATFDPRFDYGRAATTIDLGEHGVLAHAGGSRLAATIGQTARWERSPDGRGVRARFRLRAGEHAWMVLSWDAPSAEPLPAYRPFEHRRTTRQSWLEWTRQLRYDGPFRRHVVRSALLLKLLIYAPTGAMVAAPTTSLPEWRGSWRNWDYRYTWTRDTAMAIRAANRLGYLREAREFFHFVRDALTADPALHVMYAVDGTAVPSEVELAHLAGFAGSKPVRIGNGASGQLQLDTAGALLDAAGLYAASGGTLGLRAWRRLSHVVEGVMLSWTQPDHGIWEPRGGMRHHVHSRAMSWLALRRGRELAALFGDDARARTWASLADTIRDDVLAQGLDPTGRHFVGAYGSDAVDAALLLLPLHRFVPVDDPRALATVEAVRAQLGSGPFLYRYREDDGVGGPEGAFVLCGFWLAEVLAANGRVEEAQEVFAAHAEASNHLGLLSEQIDPDGRELLGNFPQAFSHLGLVNAAIGIDAALRRRDEQPHERRST